MSIDTAGTGVEARLVVFWHHGTPNIGAPPRPLFPAAAQLGIRRCPGKGMAVLLGTVVSAHLCRKRTLVWKALRCGCAYGER
jgi:hypothetical protein